MDEYSAGPGPDARRQARLFKLDLLSCAGSNLLRVLRYLRFSLAEIFSASGQGWKSPIHSEDAQGCIHESAAFWFGPHFRRVRLADEPELSLVLDHVGRLHFRGGGGQLDVAACPRDHGIAQ